MKLSQSQIILKLLESQDREFLSYELVKVNTPWGWLGLAACRRARELAEEGLIQAIHGGKYVKYRALPVKQLALV